MARRRDIFALAGGLLLGIAALQAQELPPATGTQQENRTQRQSTAQEQRQALSAQHGNPMQAQTTAPQQSNAGPRRQVIRSEGATQEAYEPTPEEGLFRTGVTGPVVPQTQRESAIRLLTAPPVDISSTSWLREEVDPIRQQRRKLRKMMEQRAQESLILRPEGTPQSDPNRTSGLWKITVGNTSAENWSPYEDRALDARTLRFPAPRNMSPDKRTESMKG